MIHVCVITPTISGREALLEECQRSIQAAFPVSAQHAVIADAYVIRDKLGRGPAHARNAGAMDTKADWLLFLDDDDMLLPHYWSIVEPELSTSDVVYTSWCLTGATDPVPPERFDADELRQHNTIPVTAMVRRQMFVDIGGFDTTAVREDHDLWLRMLDAGARFTYVPVTGWRYRRQPGGRTDTEDSR